MDVSVETLQGLERKVTVSVPTEELEQEVDVRLNDLARKVKLDGFRPGKAPKKMVDSLYAERVRREVASELMRTTLLQALSEENLKIAGQPQVEFDLVEKGKNLQYTALFEIFPEFTVQELNQATVEITEAKITDSDIKIMLKKLQEQNKDWLEVDRAVAENDKIILDFTGFLGEKAFDGGSAQDYELILGKGLMIPGFEEGLMGAKKDEPFEMKVTFPENYGSQELAGKEAVFKITVKKIFEGKLPELDDAFAKKFNDSDMESLTNEIKQNMERELARRVSAMNRDKTFNKLLEVNPFDTPSALVEEEIKNLKHEMYHRLYGHEHSENEKIPDFPRELFEAQAKRRVQLGLLFAEYVTKHELAANKERVQATIDQLAGMYEKPEEFRSYCQNNKEAWAELESLTMEELVAEQILKDAIVEKKTLTYEEVMNPEEGKQNEGA